MTSRCLIYIPTKPPLTWSRTVSIQAKICSKQAPKFRNSTYVLIYKETVVCAYIGTMQDYFKSTVPIFNSGKFLPRCRDEYDTN